MSHPDWCDPENCDAIAEPLLTPDGVTEFRTGTHVGTSETLMSLRAQLYEVSWAPWQFADETEEQTMASVLFTDDDARPVHLLLEPDELLTLAAHLLAVLASLTSIPLSVARPT